MKAVIIAGGKGIRLGNLTKNIPKPMLKIGNKPILEHQIDLLKRYKISEIIICTGYLSGVIEEFISKKYKDKKIRCSLESQPLGTAGCVKNLEKTLKEEDFLVIYGDIMLDMNIDYLLDYHTLKNSEATLVSHPNDHPQDSDLVEADSKNRILNFLNKPHSDDLIYKNLVNAGAYVLSSPVFDYIQKDKNQDFAKDIFPTMLKNNRKLFAYNTPEYIKDVGTPDRIKSVKKDFTSGKINRLNLSNKRPAIFLDRDGVINKEVDLLSNIEAFKLLPVVINAIRNINKTDYLTVIITNQPVVAKGFCSIEDIENIHKKMETILGRHGAKLDSIVVNDLKNDTFFAKIVLTVDGGQMEIDSRPSDALALAVRTDVAIYAEESVMDRAGILLDKETGKPIFEEKEGEADDKGGKGGKVSEEDQHRMSAFREFLDTLDLEDFDKRKS